MLGGHRRDHDPRTPFLLVILLASHPAAASDEELAILELRFTAVPPTVSHQIDARVQNTLARGGYNVIPEAKVQSRLKRAAISPGCTVGPCLQRIGGALGVRRAVRGIAGQGTSYDITLTMLETSGGTVLAQVNQRCDVCNFKEVEEAAAVATERLHKQTLVSISTRSTLVLRSDQHGPRSCSTGCRQARPRSGGSFPRAPTPTRSPPRATRR